MANPCFNPERTQDHGVSAGLAPTQFLMRPHVNTGKKQAALPQEAGWHFSASVGRGPGTNQAKRRRIPPGIGTRVPLPRRPGPPPRSAPSRSSRVRQRSRESARLLRLPRSKGPRQPGKLKAARAHRLRRRARTAPSLQGAGKRGRVRPPHSGACDWLVAVVTQLLWAGRGRAGAWPRGGEAARARLRRESQVRRTRGPGARNLHAGESPRRRGGRCGGTDAAAGAPARADPAPAAVGRPPRFPNTEEDSPFLAPSPRQPPRNAPWPRARMPRAAAAASPPRAAAAAAAPAAAAAAAARALAAASAAAAPALGEIEVEALGTWWVSGDEPAPQLLEPKHGHRNGRKGGLSGSSFFTWFMVIALLGVWTSVAVVWFELVDYEEVLAKAKDFRYNLSEVLQGKLGVYDADGDGDFDVDDAKALLEEPGGVAKRKTKAKGLKERSAKERFASERRIPSEDTELQDELDEPQDVLVEPGPLGAESQYIEDEVNEPVQSVLHEVVHTEHEDVQPEEPGPPGEPQPEDDSFLVAEPQPEDDSFLVAGDSKDQFETPEHETVPEETECSYCEEETVSQDPNQDMEDMVYDQEYLDSREPVGNEEVPHYDQVYQHSENERIGISDDVIEDSNVFSEDVYVPPEEDEQEVPPETSRKTDDPQPKETVKKKKPKLLNKFDKTIKAELNAAEKLRKRGKTEEAMKAFEELVRKYPQSPRARYGKAQCEDDLAEKRRSNEVLRGAIETYQEVANLPNVPTDLLKLTLKRRSERQQFLGHMRGSLLTLQRLVQLFPNDTSLKNDLGVGYLLIGDNDNAKKVYEEVLSVTPNDGFAKVHYGFILKTQNKIAESIPYLKEGIESGDPGTDDGRFYFHLGDAMQRVGNKEAYKWYELGHKRGHFASVWQRSLYNVNGLKAQPWWTPRETGYTELVKTLERNWKLIRDEGLAVMDKAQGLFLPEDENLREKGDWSQFTLWQQGRKNENACKGAPKTCTLLEKFPETTGCRRGQIKYSIMHPGTHVWPHTGPTNCRLRMHLGLVIPKEGCKIRCANETKTWEEGKVFIFDDSFEHEVWQDASSFRLIFIVDVWHPELTPHQRRSLPAI
ncbi:aspartyl/asparaginyl beta-hydroxylase isoform X3 [Oryctolagus cuniculus]|uniref:aspartyl/asparaginyl beta-hydroxylase isoform X3 n=1 Tax=Oryctolagus cuniculus TaxID=9986 RepID=UPI00387A70B4